MAPPLPIVLASRSPRRFELLSTLVPSAQILVQPPPSAEEMGFDGLHDFIAIEQRILEIAEAKHHSVQALLQQQGRPYLAIIAGDTTIVAFDSNKQPVVIGQPPETPDRFDLVRKWFRDYYSEREHCVLTGVFLSACHGKKAESRGFVVQSRVHCHSIDERTLEWYLSTSEPWGKAGGYGIQGAGSIFVDQIQGSLSNVIGLPLREVQQALWELEIDVGIGPG